MKTMKKGTSWLHSMFIYVLTLSLVLTAAVTGVAANGEEVQADATRGSLVIIGGALLRDNAEIYNKMIERAGGKEQAIFSIFPTASGSLSSSKKMKADLENYGVAADRVRIVEITKDNYKEKANDEAVAAQLAESTGIFFVGGDQGHITKAFYNEDGSNTKALDAVWSVYRNGGLVAGSSAGAAVMSKKMIGYTESLGAFQTGVTYDPDKEGLWVSKGLGFFTPGIVDQHFSKRGRLGRLIVALVHEKQRYGFGIDENSAMVVTGRDIEVIGSSGMFVVDASKATADETGNYEGVTVSYIEKGDKYNYLTKRFTISSGKDAIEVGNEYYGGNAVNTNIFGADAAKQVLTFDLVDNTATTATGISFDPDTGEGVKLEFSKTGKTKGYWGNYSNGADEYAALYVDVKISPIAVRIENR